MKKLIALLCAVVMIATLFAGCGGDSASVSGVKVIPIELTQEAE